jgi:hypothetical protein
MQAQYKSRKTTVDGSFKGKNLAAMLRCRRGVKPLQPRTDVMRLTVRYRGAGEAARCFGLVPTLYILKWVEKKKVEEMKETDKTGEKTTNCI